MTWILIIVASIIGGTINSGASINLHTVQFNNKTACMNAMEILPDRYYLSKEKYGVSGIRAGEIVLIKRCVPKGIK